VPGYLVPPTKNPGDVLTSALWNSYIRDNLDFGMVRPIADQILGGAAASIDLTSIPSTFAHLLVEVYARSDTVATVAAFNCRLNNDSGANYDAQNASGVAAAASAGESFAATSIGFPGVPAASAPANVFGGYVIFIPNYATTANNKLILALGGLKTGTATGTLTVDARAGFWRSSAAINRLTFTPGGNLVAGSRVTLYGMGGL